MELSNESIQIIKNIIKNQKKFNYDSLPNISYFVDSYDLYGYSALEYYCRKNNENKVLEILNTPNFTILEVEKFHPFLDCCKYKMINACKKMIELNIIPKYTHVLKKCISYCFCLKMEEIAILLFDKIDMQIINPIYKKKNRINPLHDAIKNDLRIITNYLFNYYEKFDIDINTNDNLFLFCCKYNKKEYIDKIMEIKKENINLFYKNYYNESPIYWLIYYKNEDILLKLYEIVNENDKKIIIAYLRNNKLEKLVNTISNINH
jgi:hypothetical protein